MCPINFVFISCTVKKQESPEYHSNNNYIYVYNVQISIGNHALASTIRD
jgi:hypothetical protein